MMCRIGVLLSVLICECTLGITITSPPSQRVQPGQWVSVQFVVDLASTPDFDVSAPPQLSAPTGWPVLVPPSPWSSKAQLENTKAFMSAVVEVPTNARPGWHGLTLSVGEYSAQALVDVEAFGQLAFRSNDDVGSSNPSHSWWGHAPWTHQWMLNLEGNMTQDVSIQVKVPEEFRARVSPLHGSVSADAPLPVEVELEAPSNWLPGRRVSVMVMALNDQGERLAQTRVSLSMKGQRNSSPSVHWPVRVYGQSALGAVGGGRQDEFAWGISGGGVVPWAEQSSLQFSLHSQAHRPSRVAYRGHAVSWSVGRQGFADPVLSWVRRWGEGVTWQWASAHAPNAQRVRLGLSAFEDATTRYWQPSIGWGPWQGALWSMETIGVEGREQKSQGVRFRYERPPGPDGAWRWDVAYHARRWAGSMHWQRQGPKRRWRILARVVPANFSRQMPAVQYFSMGLGQRLSGERQVSARIDWSQGVATGPSRRSGVLIYDQPVSYLGSGRLQWGLQVWDSPRHPRPGQAFVDWRVRHHPWQWRTRLDSTGHWQARLNWRPHRGVRGYVRYQSQPKPDGYGARLGLGLESDLDHRWQWSFGWMRQDPSIVESFKTSEEMRFDTPTTQLSVLVSRLLGHGHRLSVSVNQSKKLTGDARLDRRVWLRYQWQGQLTMPRLLPHSTGELIGEVVMQTPSGNIGLPGVVIEAQGQTTTTDALGRYRFKALSIGQAQVRLDLSSLQSNHLTLEGGSQTTAIHSGQPQRLNWTVIEAGAMDGQLLWPAQSPQPADFDGLVLGFMCMDCPGVVSTQWAPVSSSGHFEVKGLMPGHWQARIVGGQLPAEHHWPSLAQVEVQPNKTVQVSWPLDYRPWPIHWSSDAPLPVGGMSP